MFTVEIRIFISVLHLLKRCIHRALFCCELLWRQIQLNFMCKRPFTIFLSFFFHPNSPFAATLMSWWIAPGWLALASPYILNIWLWSYAGNATISKKFVGIVESTTTIPQIYTKKLKKIAGFSYSRQQIQIYCTSYFSVIHN